MKKFLYLAAAAAMMASCMEIEELNSVKQKNDEPVVIGSVQLVGADSEAGGCGIFVEPLVEPRESYPGIGQGDIGSDFPRVDALGRSELLAGLPFVTAFKPDGEGLAMMEGIALGEGDA